MRINGLESDNWRVERDDCGQLVIAGFGNEMEYTCDDNSDIEELARMLMTLAAGENLEI